MSLCQKNNIKNLCFLCLYVKKNNIKEAFCSVFVSTQVQAPRFTFCFAKA